MLSKGVVPDALDNGGEKNKAMLKMMMLIVQMKASIDYGKRISGAMRG